MRLLQRMRAHLAAFTEPVIIFNDGAFVENPIGNPDIDVRFLRYVWLFWKLRFFW